MVQTKKYRIATFNLLNFTAPPQCFYHVDEKYSEEQWLAKRNFIVSTLKRVNADFIAFQEVFSAQALKTICEQAGLKYFAVVDTPKQDKHNTSILFSPVVAVSSKFPFKSLSKLEMAPDFLKYMGALDSGFNRSPLKSVIELPSIGAVTIYAVHFKSQRLSCDTSFSYDSPFPLIKNNFERSLEAASILDDIYKNELDNPTILLGDFNQNLSHQSLNFLVASNEASEAIMTDSHTQVNLLSSQSIDKPPTHFYKGQGNYLDYILLRNLTCKKYLTFAEHLDSSDDNDDITQTDHAVIAVEIIG